MTGEELRDDGIEQVIEHSFDWSQFAIENLRQWLAWKRSQGVLEVTTEDYKKDFLTWYPDMTPHHPNCWGAITRTAALAGLILPTEKYTKMTLDAAHSRHARVWQIP